MSTLDQYSTIERVNRYLRRLGQQKSSDMSLILEYDKKYRDLCVWLWYVDTHIGWRGD
jgi:hypothetical protein